MVSSKHTSGLVVGTWNTLEASNGGAWSTQWGCPLEIERRNQLMANCVDKDNDNESSIDADKASFARNTNCLEDSQSQLTFERYRRIENYLLESHVDDGHCSSFAWGPCESRVVDNYDLLFVQEITPNMAWTIPRGVPLPTSRFVDCERYDIDTTTEFPTADFAPSVQRIWSKGTNLHAISSKALTNPYVPGCVASFWVYDGSVLVAASIHAIAKTIRDDETRSRALESLLQDVLSVADEIAPLQYYAPNILICGDWNVELSIVGDWMKGAIGEEDKLTVGLLQDVYGDATRSSFSTNHESGDAAQYDGCILWSKQWSINEKQVKSKENSTSETPSTPDSTQDTSAPNSNSDDDNSNNTTKRETRGFMPKGIDGAILGLFEYQYSIETDKPPGVYYNGTLIPESIAEKGMSDHMLITTHISIPTNSGDAESASFVLHQFVVLLVGFCAAIYLLFQVVAWQIHRLVRAQPDYQTLVGEDDDDDDSSEYGIELS